MAGQYTKDVYSPGPLRFILDALYQSRSRRPTEPSVGIPFTEGYRPISSLLPSDFEGEENPYVPIRGSEETFDAIKRRQKMLDEAGG